MPASIVSNTVIATAGRSINVVLGLLVVKLVTGFLGPSGYGAYALLLSFGTILQLVADGGLYLQLTRSIAQAPHRESELTSHILSLRIVLLCVVFVIGAGTLAALPTGTSLTRPFIIIALGLSFQSVSQLFMGIFQYHQVVWRATIGDLIGRLGQIISVIYFGLSGAAVSGMVAAFTVGSGLAWLTHQLALPVRRPRLAASWPAWKELLHSSWPLGALLLLNAIYFRIDTVVLSFWRTPAEVGWYSLAYRVIESALFFPAMFGGLLLPRLTEAATGGHQSRLRQYLTQSLGLQLVVVGFIIITLLMRAEAIIYFIADASFSPAAPILQLLSVALGIMFFGNIFGFTMIALHKQNSLLKIYGVLAVANTIGNILTVPRWGMTAAAVTTIITEAIATICAGWIIWRDIPYRLPVRSMSGTLAAACIAGTIYILLPVQWPLLTQVALAAAGYSAGILAARSITVDQLSLLRA